MTSRERLLKTLRGEIPDCVPVAPDFSNMIPARLTGKPFWDLYLYRDPPIWEAYIACTKHFGIDSLMDGYFRLAFPEETEDTQGWEQYIVERGPDRIITQRGRKENGRIEWKPAVNVYYVADPPTYNVPVERLRMAPEPKRWEPVEGIRPVEVGAAGIKRVKELMGDQGLVGISIAHSKVLGNEDDIYRYMAMEPIEQERWAQERVEAVERRFEQLMAMDVRPDFVCVGGSGTLVTQTVEIFRQLAFPAVKRAIELATNAGMMTQVHSCGPERELVRIMAEETNLTVIDPLEVPPMGDCDLADLKRRFGSKITLKGNLHTTKVMLHGSVDDVIAASKKAIDDAAEGGRFILSTGDQCGRDTPFENLEAMIETARTYGRY